MISNFRLVKAIDLKFGKQEAPTQDMAGEIFIFTCLLIVKLWSYKLDMCGRPLFENPVT